MKQKIYILLLLICVLPLSEEAGAQEVTLTITNPGHNQRQEVAEASLQTICELLETDSTAPHSSARASGRSVPTSG